LRVEGAVGSQKPVRVVDEPSGPVEAELIQSSPLEILKNKSKREGPAEREVFWIELPHVVQVIVDANWRHR
jgi:hypothetical protein